MGDSQRWVQLARQAAKGTLATTFESLTIMEEYDHTTKREVDIPDLKVNMREQRRRGRTKTRLDEVNIKGRIDSYQFGLLLGSALAVPTGPTSKVWSWLSGGTQALPVSGSNSMLLSARWGEGLDMAWTAKDMRVAQLKIMCDWKANMTFEALLRGVGVENVGAITPVITEPASNPLLYPEMGIMTINGAGGGYCVVSMELDIDNGYDPFYCGPLALRTPGQVHGLQPNRFLENPPKYDFKSLTDFTTYVAGTPYYDADHDTTESMVFEWRDADIDLGSGVYPGMRLTLPKEFATKADLQRAQNPVLASVDGEPLHDDTLGAAFKLELITNRTAFTAS